MEVMLVKITQVCLRDKCNKRFECHVYNFVSIFNLFMLVLKSVLFVSAYQIISYEIGTIIIVEFKLTGVCTRIPLWSRMSRTISRG